MRNPRCSTVYIDNSLGPPATESPCRSCTLNHVAAIEGGLLVLVGVQAIDWHSFHRKLRARTALTLCSICNKYRWFTCCQTLAAEHKASHVQYHIPLLDTTLNQFTTSLSARFEVLVAVLLAHYAVSPGEVTDVSNDGSAFIFRVKQASKNFSPLLACVALKFKALWFIETSVTACHLTRSNAWEDIILIFSLILNLMLPAPFILVLRSLRFPDGFLWINAWGRITVIRDKSCVEICGFVRRVRNVVSRNYGSSYA